MPSGRRDLLHVEGEGLADEVFDKAPAASLDLPQPSPAGRLAGTVLADTVSFFVITCP